MSSCEFSENKQPVVQQQPKFQPPNSLSCKRNDSLER